MSLSSARARAARRASEASATNTRLPITPSWERISATDLSYVAAARSLLQLTPRPIHSNFLVAAVITYTDAAGRLRHVSGVNSETCVLSSSICAERCALAQLRLLPSFAGSIDTVYLTSSMEDDLVTPGVLCREFMVEYGSPEITRIFMFSGDWRPASADREARGLHQIYRLGELYPLSPIYHRIPRASLEAKGQASYYSFRLMEFTVSQRPPRSDCKNATLSP